MATDERDYRSAFQAMVAGKAPEFFLADMGGRVASLCAPVYSELKAFLGLGEPSSGETLTMLNTIGEFDEAVLQRLGVGFRRLFVRPPDTFELVKNTDGSFLDEWGILYRPQGPYVERVGHPLADARIADLDSFAWPNTGNKGRYVGLTERAEALHRDSRYILCAGHISAGIFQDCWNLRGMERFMTDMALDDSFAHALLRRVTDFHIGIWREVLSRIGHLVDIVETADDLGTQSGLLISPDMYRRMIKPYHAELNTEIRRLTEAMIFYHSCGAVMPLIDDLIDAGVNILNPVQPLSGLMEPEDMVERFGGRVIFHGGLDVQDLLINGTVGEVKTHAERYYRILGKRGYIMAPTNSVQPGTRVENLVGVYDGLAWSG